MMNRSYSVALLTVSLVAIVSMFVSYGYFSRSASEDGIWRFNFSPAQTPDIESFITISGATDYSRWRGYGWFDAVGPLETGHWPADKGETWESRANLNVITRRGPDDLARSFATGEASFVLDLEPGRYQVWVLSGDSGHLEYTPWQPYRIVVEGVEAYRYAITSQQFHHQFETPLLQDDLTEAGVWQRYIEPRFKWSQVLVDVVDGQLNVVVAGAERDRSKIGLAGDYSYTEDGRGPKKRYTGAINGMVVIPFGKHASHGAKVIAHIDALRRQNFNNHWPIQADKVKVNDELKLADHDRGYTVFLPHTLDTIYPHSVLPHQPGNLSLRTTPGETASLTIAMCPFTDIGDTSLEFVSLQGPVGGDEAVVDIRAQLDVGVVRYAARAVGGEDRTWRPTPAMIVPTNNWNMRKDVCKQFWLNLRIPDEMAPGDYKGTITITPTNAGPYQLEVALEVLPFKLQRPTHLALGMTYFSPMQDAWFDEERFWRRMTAEFADMRAHGFTTIQYTGIGIDDYERLDRMFRLYREAGFDQPLVLLESYGAMDRLRRDGIAWDTEKFLSSYQQSIRQLLTEAERRQWPPIIINFGDEFTNSALEEFGVKVARSLKQIPGVVTSADANGYKEVTLLAPEVDIVAFNNGWAGPEGVNKGKKLLHRGTVEQIKQAGAEPWLVNVGKDRFSNGYWLWKMVGLGVRGKMEWIYRSYKGIPHNSFDAEPMRDQIVFPGPGGTVISSLDYQRMRMGFDDLSYLYTLERLLVMKKNSEYVDPAVVRADAFLLELEGLIEDDMNRYINGDTKRWPAKQYDIFRNEIIDHILRLSP
jgi:hypothetical protein